METNLTVYRSLQRRIDELPVPFPATEAGVELRLLQHLFSPEEAAVACELSAVSETVSKIHRRINKKGFPYTERSLKKLLNALLKNGAITGGIAKTKRGVERTYSLMPLAIGMFEMQVDNLSAEYTRDFEEYLQGGFSEALFNNRTGQMRTIPVSSAVASVNGIGVYDDLRRVVGASAGPFGVMNCVCRQGKDLLEKSCSHSDIRETCLMIGDSAAGMHRRGNARIVERDEFLELLHRAEEKGFVLQAKNIQAPEYICCCCGDCCEILTTAKKLPRPVEAFHTNYFARVESDLCNGCGRCVARCQMDAVSLTGPAAETNGRATAIVDLDRCIGCGLCVSTCSAGSLSLVPAAKTTVPPRNSLGMYGRMYLERRGLIGAMIIAFRYLFGLRI
jgi:NAD-dependent dihydropyrimidine dehydrogenase PreA subunit